MESKETRNLWARAGKAIRDLTARANYTKGNTLPWGKIAKEMRHHGGYLPHGLTRKLGGSTWCAVTNARDYGATVFAVYKNDNPRHGSLGVRIPTAEQLPIDLAIENRFRDKHNFRVGAGHDCARRLTGGLTETTSESDGTESTELAVIAE